MADVYSIDVMVCMTAYIVAGSEAEAQSIADGLKDETLEFSNRYQPLDGDICMDGRSFESIAENDEAVALSPAVTIHGPAEGAQVEFVETVSEECQTCAQSIETRVSPCDECGAIDEDDGEDELPDVPDDHPVQPIEFMSDEYHEARARNALAQCGGCSRMWDDSIATSYTPVPAGRCPFEAYHKGD